MRPKHPLRLSLRKVTRLRTPLHPSAIEDQSDYVLRPAEGGKRAKGRGVRMGRKHARTVQSRWLRPLPRRSCSLRLFVAPPFAQQLIILSWVVAFEAIECIVRRLNRGSADLLFDCVDVPGGLLQTAQRFLGQWLSLSQSDCDLRKPTKLFSIARDLRNHPVLDCGIASIVDGKRRREPRRCNALGYVPGPWRPKHPQRIKA